MSGRSLSAIVALQDEAEAVLRRYDDASEDVVDRRAALAQLAGMRASLSTSAYAEGPYLGAADFGCILAARPEFARSAMQPASPADAASCERGWFMMTPNQTFVKNFMAVHDCLLLFHDVGTGKSCSAIATAEHLLDAGVFKKKTLVLMPKSLKPAFVRQVFDTDRLTADDVASQCTGDKYVRMATQVSPSAGLETLSMDKLASGIQRLVKQRYDVMSYGEFANAVRSKCDAIRQRVSDADAQAEKIARALQEIVGDRLIIMDEVHRIKVGGTGEEDAKLTAPMVDLAMQHARNSKLLMMTATPMFDRAEEIVWLLNLMRRVTGQLPLDSEDVFAADGRLKPAGLGLLRSAVSGCVSYLGAENPWTHPIRLDPSINRDPRMMTAAMRPTKSMHGEPIPADAQLRETPLVVSRMSTSQQRVYQATLPKVLRLAVSATGSDDKQRSGLSSLIQVSNIDWPSGDDAVGDDAMRVCLVVTEKKGRKRYAYHPRAVAKHGRFLGAARLGEHAPKMRAIVEYVRNSTGVVYVYSQFLSAGVIPLALALEHAGVQPLHPERRLWASQGEGSVDAPITVAGKPARYLLLSGEHKQDPRDVEAARSAANAAGDVVKIVLCSAVGTEGVDLRHVREVHILDPWFNTSRVLQATGRAVRRCSHFDLDPSLRNVTVYNHAALLSASATESVDYNVYRLAENKHRVVQQVQDLMRQHAVDCRLNNPPPDPRAVKERLTLVTSQGKTIKDFALWNGKAVRAACAECGKGAAAAARVDLRDNLAALLDGIDEYRRLAVGPMFAQRAHWSFAELAGKAREVFKARFDDQTLAACLQHMLVRRTSLVGPADERGSLIFSGGEYVFQPAWSDDPSLSLAARSGSVGSKRPLSILMKGGAALDARRQEGGLAAVVQNAIARTEGVFRGALAWFGFGAFVALALDELAASQGLGLEPVAGDLCRRAHQGRPMTTLDMHVLRRLHRAGVWKLEGGRGYALLSGGRWKRVLPSGEVLPSTSSNTAQPQSQSQSQPLRSRTRTRGQLQARLRQLLPETAIRAGAHHAATAVLAELDALAAHSAVR